MAHAAVGKMRSVLYPPQFRIRVDGKLYDKPVQRALFGHWQHRWAFYRQYKGETTQRYRGLAVQLDALTAYRILGGNLFAEGHYIFSS